MVSGSPEKFSEAAIQRAKSKFQTIDECIYNIRKNKEKEIAETLMVDCFWSMNRNFPAASNSSPNSALRRHCRSRTTTFVTGGCTTLNAEPNRPLSQLDRSVVRNYNKNLEKRDEILQERGEKNNINSGV